MPFRWGCVARRGRRDHPKSHLRSRKAATRLAIPQLPRDVRRLLRGGLGRLRTAPIGMPADAVGSDNSNQGPGRVISLVQTIAPFGKGAIWLRCQEPSRRDGDGRLHAWQPREVCACCLGRYQSSSWPEQPGNPPHDPLSVATLVPEIRCNVSHTEGEEGVIGIVGRPQIGALDAIENSPGHPVGNDDCSTYGLLEGPAIGRRCFDRGPVDCVMRCRCVLDHQMLEKLAYQIKGSESDGSWWGTCIHGEGAPVGENSRVRLNCRQRILAQSCCRRGCRS